MEKTLEHYKGLPYKRTLELITEDDSRYWLASIEDLPGCKADGNTPVEAMANLDDVFDDYISAKLEWGSPIPDPRRESSEVDDVSPLESGMPRVEDIVSCSNTQPAQYENPKGKRKIKRVISNLEAESETRNTGQLVLV